ncbi:MULTISPECIES: ABC transporter substrate-binding protein [unclassified Microbacterium]|uniref:ABC transporter substrate-binding protein n=1 Tax=unclassified Microbacterium TaxID=2609290 RepID=UPI00214B0331|nr:MULTISPECIES: ABC transporter substrate-binding protein [unclassified Microbacterium]MCR2783478.1 ABC transporter substrate-binding protein [Microbacterium sp. zg.B96]MDL5351735.1 ABC transporter substrate-binding protein [Microbacterium sp. zg-YB36]WIM15659.1 ABC transporter substrate-binding protein [Microbacterium sp. zg-B96]
MFSTKRAITAVALATGAALALAGCAGGGGDAEPAEEFDPNEKVTLDLAFWGNDVRAELYNEAIAAFNEEYPNITVNASFLGFPEFWEKRQTEAAGGGLPDVMQFDYSYLRQYAENDLLLDLDPFLGEIIETEPLSENILSIGVVNDATYAIPTSTNAWGLFTNPVVLESVGVEDFAGGSWDDYAEWMTEITEAGGGEFYGGSDYTGRIQNFELQLRSEDSYLFNEEGEPGFDEERLTEFWEEGAPLRDGVAVPQQRIEELVPLGPFDTGMQAAELTWDNFGAGYLANLGEGYTELNLLEPPVTEEGAKDLYLKPSMLHAISSKSDHPEAAATLVNFLINSPESGAIFGTNRGLPASETALEAAELDPLSQQVADHEAAIADRLGDAPPVPIVGFGTLEEKFRQLGTELNFGTITVDEAVAQFFSEMDIVLNG